MNPTRFSMRLLVPALAATLPLGALLSCKPEAAAAPAGAAATGADAGAAAAVAVVEPAADPIESVVRVNTTRQAWNPSQPWEKLKPRNRRSLGAIVGPGQVLTTAEMVADHTYIELESPDGKKLAPGRLLAVDYEANLALLGLEDPEADAGFFDRLDPLELADPVGIGSELEIIQVEDSGVPLVTTGTVQQVDILADFLPGEYFLTYEVKASMQSAASSFSLPALHDGRLAGVVTSYDSDDQICNVLATEIVNRFVEEAVGGGYRGVATLGIAVTPTDDQHFRRWLKIPDDAGGIYISSLLKEGSAEKAGVRKGDVLLSVAGHDIDRLGYYEHEIYGRLYWSHLVRGSRTAGDEVALVVLRDGEKHEINAVLERREASDQLVPKYTYGSAPNYLVKGGLVFQELTRPLLRSFGDEWESRAPLDLLDALENPEKYEDRADRIVFLSGVIATPATIGYEPLRNLVVEEVNGRPIRDMADLVDAFATVPDDGLHSIRFAKEDFTVHLDELVSTQVDTQLLQRGLTRLSRVPEEMGGE